MTTLDAPEPTCAHSWCGKPKSDRQHLSVEDLPNPYISHHPFKPTEAPAPAAPSAQEVVDSPEGQALIAEGRADFAAGRYEPLVPAAPSVVEEALEAWEKYIEQETSQFILEAHPVAIFEAGYVAARVSGGPCGAPDCRGHPARGR